MLLALVAGGCNRDPAVIVGDVYIMEEMGTQQSLGLLPVHLVPDDIALDSALLKRCPNRDLTVVPDSQQIAAAWASRDQLLLANSIRSTVTDAGASFAFDSIESGWYRLWADTVVGQVHWTWLARVLVLGNADTVRANLSIANTDEDPFRCFRKW